MVNTIHRQDGFAHIELVLILVAVVGILGGVGYVAYNRFAAHNTLSDKTASSASAVASPANATPLDGSSTSITQITSNDASTEGQADSSGDGSVQQSTTTDDSAANSVGGAYDENNI